jgi:IS1 family transposase
MSGVSKPTILKLIRDLGAACEDYHQRNVVNVSCKRIQCDEIWSFCYAKAKNVPDSKKGEPGVGDVWTWVALDPDSKLVISWLVGTRDAGCAWEFMQDVSSRLANRVQLTTDGLSIYLGAVEDAFGCEIDYAQLVKLYGSSPEGEKRYSPAVCNGVHKTRIQGSPDPDRVCTSHVERQNLTIRMGLRRFTRLTNAFSKRIDCHVAALAIHYMYYNFCRIHQTLRITPAMEAGVTDHLRSLEDLVGFLET